MLKVKFCPFAIVLASKWKGRSDGASAEDRVEQLKGLREPLHVLCRASVTEGNIPGEMRGTLQPHRGPADDHEFNARVVKNASLRASLLVLPRLLCDLENAGALRKTACAFRRRMTQSRKEQSQINAEFLRLGQFAPWGRIGDQVQHGFFLVPGHRL